MKHVSKFIRLSVAILLCISVYPTFGQVSKTVNVSVAGTLSTYMSTTEARTIQNLTLTGNIDARDIKFIRNVMFILNQLDIGGTSIVAFTGEGGTISGINTYPADELPSYSFYNPDDGFHQALDSIVLPPNITSIGRYAFTYNNRLTSIIFPSSLTKIETAAFYGCSGFTSIILPDNLISIGNTAFASCSRLTSITFPTGLTSIGYRAFFHCPELTSVTFPASLTLLEAGAFEGCSKLTGTLILPPNLTVIGDSAFFYCSSLTSLTLPANVTTIGVCAFAKCTGLTGTLNLPASLTTIKDIAFTYCSELTGRLILPKNLTFIGNYAFAECNKITGELNIPSGITDIGVYAFAYCFKLTSVTFPSNLTSIGSYAFAYCNGLTGTLNIPSGVTSMGNYAFFESAITELILPETLNSIGSYAFGRCLKLTTIVNMKTTPISITSNVFENYFKTLRVPTASINLYKNAPVWKYFSIIGNDVVVSVSANNTAYGSVSGGGTYTYNTKATLTATAKQGYKFVNWTSKGIVISTASSFTFTATKDTTIVANFTNNDVGITDASNPVYLTNASPNPVQDVLKISGLSGNENIALYDMTGRTLYICKAKDTEILLPVNHLAKGIYFVRINNHTTTKTIKIVKD